MERGFRVVLIGVIIVALAYTALSVWPVLTAPPAKPQLGYTPQGPGITAPPLVSPRQNAPAQNPSPGATPQPSANQVQQGNVAPGQTGPNPAGQAAPNSNPPVFTNRRVSKPPPPQGPPLLTTPLPAKQPEKPIQNEVWKYALRSARLYVEPNGPPHSSTSLNNSPLIIGRGSHVVPLEYREGWVMVRSPGHTLGWMRDTDLTDTPPVVLVNEFIVN